MSVSQHRQRWFVFFYCLPYYTVLSFLKLIASLTKQCNVMYNIIDFGNLEKEMKRRKIIVWIAAIFCVAFLGIKIVKELYLLYRPLETIVYGDSDNSDENESLIYDTKPISDAYLKGNTSKLSDFDKKIYDKATEILDSIIKNDMTDYDKELAVHDYMLTHIMYDTKNLSVFHKKDKNSETPYGALYNGKAICIGYTVTFKMFMDMLEIPNLIVYGEDADRDDHAWNMIELDGDWYYVDVTWNDPTPDYEGRIALHKYFNVTEDFMRENKHCWDSTELPKANSTKYSYEKMTVKSIREIEYEIQTMY